MRCMRDHSSGLRDMGDTSFTQADTLLTHPVLHHRRSRGKSQRMSPELRQQCASSFDPTGTIVSYSRVQHAQDVTAKSRKLSGQCALVASSRGRLHSSERCRRGITRYLRKSCQRPCPLQQEVPVSAFPHGSSAQLHPRICKPHVAWPHERTCTAHAVSARAGFPSIVSERTSGPHPRMSSQHMLPAARAHQHRSAS